MQTPPDQNNPYEQQGFTAVPGAGAPAQGGQPFYAPQPPVQQPAPPQMGPGVPPPYTPAPQQTPPGMPQQAPGQEQYAPQDAYYQNVYPQQSPEPFSQRQMPYQAPKRRNYSKVNLILGAVIGILIIVLAVVAVSQMLGNQQTRMAPVTAGTLGANYTGDAVIVRNETMYTQEGISQIDYLAVEGSVVSRGTTVCTVYTSGFSAKEWTTLNNYRTQIKDYQKTLLAGTNIEADPQLKRFNTAVLERAAETQELVQGASGSLLNQESLLSSAIKERSYYLKQKYADDQKLSRLYDEEKTQLQRIETWTKQFGAGDTGLVSFYTDGFERVLTTSNYNDFTPAQVRAMYQGKLPASAALGRNEVAVYRMVRQGSFAVLMLCDNADWTPTVGASYELLIESFDNTRVSATVESVTRSGGELLVRLIVSGDVSQVLYIRSCHVQLSESIYSLTVPVSALLTQDGQIGVVMVQSDGEYFMPVTVVSQDSSEAHIIPAYDNVLTAGMYVLVF